MAGNIACLFLTILFLFTAFIFVYISSRKQETEVAGFGVAATTVPLRCFSACFYDTVKYRPGTDLHTL